MCGHQELGHATRIRVLCALAITRPTTSTQKALAKRPPSLGQRRGITIVVVPTKSPILAISKALDVFGRARGIELCVGRDATESFVRLDVAYKDQKKRRLLVQNEDIKRRKSSG
jgi:hypothetical protein